MTTSDGLSLSLSASGSVTSLQIGGTDYGSSGIPSGFFYRESTTSMPNGVGNGSFESGSGSPSGWTISGGSAGTWSIDSSNASNGSRSMKLSISGSSGQRSPDLTSATFPTNPNTPYILTCSFKASNAGGSGLTMYLWEQDQSGAWTQRQVPSPVGTHDWVTRTISFTSNPTSVQAYVKFYVSGGYGTNWVDDVRITEPFGGHTPVAFAGSVTAGGGVVTQTGSEAGLNLAAQFTSIGSAIRVDVTLTDATGGNRGIELSYRLPLDLAGWTWDDDFATPQTIVSGTRYENLNPSFATATRGHTHSTYPFAAVHNSSAAFSMAVPMGPLMDRLTYDDSWGLCLMYDVGLSPATQNPSTATFSFWIYTSDAKWGMRAAAAKYYALNPAAFSGAATVAGAWETSSQPLSTVPNPEDFGMGYEEGRTELDFDNAHGILGMNYISFPEWDINFSGYSSQPPYDVLLGALNDALTDSGSTVDGTPTAAMAAAVVAASPYDQNGLLQLGYNAYFWYSNVLQMYPVVPYSTLPGGTYGLRTQYGVDRQIANAQAQGNTLGGVFLDNTTNAFANIENYRQELWAYNTTPLSFSYRSGQVVQYTGDGMADFIAAFQSYLHGKGLVLQASGPIFAWFAAHLDVMGSEVRGPQTLDRAYALRTLGYGRVLTNLFVPLSADPPPSATDVLAYLRQALLLGYFPGFNGKYWNSPASYERDRPLFQQYVPLLKTLAQAGWQPVNYATSSDPSTLVERFGAPADGTFYITAQNPGSSSSVFTLTLDGTGLGISDSTPVSVADRIDNGTVSVVRNGADVVFSAALAAGETRLYAITLAGGGGGGPPPIVDSLAPSSGPASGGADVTIIGSDFQPGAVVSIGGNPAAEVSVVDATTITARAPLLPAGTLNDIVVTNPDQGTGILATGFLSDFGDVPGSNLFHADVEKVFRDGIAVGCGGGMFCPGSAVTRAQQAVFLLKAKHGPAYQPPPATGIVFQDVPVTAFAAAWIEELAAEGISSGCGAGSYCPNASLSRAQMAVLLLKASHGSNYVPPPATGIFEDVPVGSFAADWIEQLFTEGVTAGCGDGNYCPTAAVPRGQMATFVVRTFGLP